MSERPTFVSRALAGEAFLDEIDDYVDAWHESKSAEDLAEYLGLSEEEYALWVEVPDALGIIVSARSDRRSLHKALNDNFEELKVAARAADTPKIARLKTWLRKLNKIS